MGVAGFQGVEGPFDETNAPAEGFIALEELQEPADAAVTVRGDDRSHVRVEVGRSVAYAGQGQGEADHLVARESTQHLTAGLLSDDESDIGFNFQVAFAPDFALDFDAAVAIGERGGFTHLDLGGHRDFDFAVDAGGGEFSRPLASSHRDSICGRGVAERVVPFSRARFSMLRKRRGALALDFFMAISGSTFRDRARLTTTQSRY